MSILINSFIILLCTFMGSCFAVILKKAPINIGASLAFTGGVMIVASFTSLILPGIEAGGFWMVALGIVMGFAVIAIIENTVPHEHFIKGKEGLSSKWISRISLIILAIIIHNIPEGFSVGVSSAYSYEKGLETAIAIGVQDIPEGFIVTLPLMVITNKIFKPLWIGFLSGFVESVFSLLAYVFFGHFKELLAIGMGMGGGAMVYVTAKEVFPECYEKGNHTQATVAFLFGFLLMLFLDVTL